jgi:hypothetical protein
LAAKPAYILAMKLKALERTTADDRDYRDAVKLGIACGATTADGLRDVFRKLFPDEALPLVAELRNCIFDFPFPTDAAVSNIPYDSNFGNARLGGRLNLRADVAFERWRVSTRTKRSRFVG